MPKGINGRETYEEIIKIRPGQKAIIASGFSETEDVKIAQKLGAGKYIKQGLSRELKNTIFYSKSYCSNLLSIQGTLNSGKELIQSMISGLKAFLPKMTLIVSEPI